MNQLTDLIWKTIKDLGPDCEKPANMILIGNGKTGKSLESKSGCPLMKQTLEGYFNAPKCPSCYAVSLMNNYPSLRKILKNENHCVRDIILSAAGMDNRKRSGVPVFPGDRLRLYGITDFSPINMPAIRQLARVYKLDVISKTLWLNRHNHKHLIELASLPHINISLSFNKDIPFWKARMEETAQLVRDNKIGHVVGLNYTFTSSYRKTGRSKMEPIRAIPGVGVYHITSKDKDKITRSIGSEAGVCGIFDAAGQRLHNFKAGKGSCLNCNFCRTQVLDNIETPVPMEAL